MPQVVILPAALRGLERLEAFLLDKNAEAAVRVGETLLKAMRRLGDSPYIGRPGRATSAS
jgi:plasmid stabilization system protein ParE